MKLLLGQLSEEGVATDFTAEASKVVERSDEVDKFLVKDAL